MKIHGVKFGIQDVLGWFMVAAAVMIPFIVVAGYLKKYVVMP